MSFDVEHDVADSASGDGSPAIEVQGLTNEFGPVRAVDDLSFTVARGELFGFPDRGPDAAADQEQLFYRNFIGIGACLIMFGTFATLGPELRYVITAPLFNF